MFDKAGVPQPGSLEESLLLRVWYRRQQIERLQSLALLLSGQSDLMKKASEAFDSAWDMMLPKTGDMRSLEIHEKDAVAFLKRLADGTAFRITPDQAHGFTRIRSRLNRMRKAGEQGRGNKWQGKQ